jgi:hypothetical protein
MGDPSSREYWVDQANGARLQLSKAAREIDRLTAEVDKRDEVIKTQLTVLEQQDAELQKQDKHIASLNGAAIKALHAFKDYCGKNPEEDQEDLMEEFMDLSDLVVDPDA